MTQYRKNPNCGPINYPDGSGRMLVDEETLVEGAGWDHCVELGYLIEVPMQETVIEPLPMLVETLPATAPVLVEAPQSNTEEAVDGTNDGATAPAVDTETVGSTSPESGAGPKPPRGRRPRG